MSEQYPEGKLLDGDEGELEVGFAIINGAVVIKFGKPVVWIGLPRDKAIAFANIIKETAEQIAAVAEPHAGNTPDAGDRTQ